MGANKPIEDIEAVLLAATKSALFVRPTSVWALISFRRWTPINDKPTES
jgi:hypothetical protein